MATTSAWKPPRGTHNVGIGPGLHAALEALDNGSSHSGVLKEYYTFKYDFRPESLDNTKPGRIESIDAKKDGPSTFKFNQPSTQGQDISFGGTQRQCKDLECVLIYDEDTNTFYLDRLDSVVDLKYDRSATSRSNGGAQSPMDHSPTSGATQSSSSPPTPPNLNYTAQDTVRISDPNSDFEVEEPLVARVKAKASQPPRPSHSGKSVIINNTPPAASSSKGKNKRSRDTYETKEPVARPPPKPPAPVPTPAPAPPAPLSLPSRPTKTLPSKSRPSTATKSIPSAPSFHLDLDEDDVPVPASPPKLLSRGFTLEVEENPQLPPPPPRQHFAEGLEEEEPNIDTMFDDVDDEEDGEAEGEADDDDDDFGDALLDAMNEPEPTQPVKVPMSLNAYAGGQDDDDDDDQWQGDDDDEDEDSE